jgi:hypothetical protein
VKEDRRGKNHGVETIQYTAMSLDRPTPRSRLMADMTSPPRNPISAMIQELYDLEADPFEQNNRVNDIDLAATLIELQAQAALIRQ